MMCFYMKHLESSNSIKNINSAENIGAEENWISTEKRRISTYNVMTPTQSTQS